MQFQLTEFCWSWARFRLQQWAESFINLHTEVLILCRISRANRSLILYKKDILIFYLMSKVFFKQHNNQGNVLDFEREDDCSNYHASLCIVLHQASFTWNYSSFLNALHCYRLSIFSQGCASFKCVIGFTNQSTPSHWACVWNRHFFALNIFDASVFLNNTVC